MNKKATHIARQPSHILNFEVMHDYDMMMVSTISSKSFSFVTKIKILKTFLLPHVVIKSRWNDLLVTVAVYENQGFTGKFHFKLHNTCNIIIFMCQ